MKILWATTAHAVGFVGIVSVAALCATACTRAPAPAKGEGTTTEATSPAVSTPGAELGAAAQLDSGNTAYRRKDYTAALMHYRAAAAREPSLAAAWMGVAMALNALGDKAAADSAMRKVEQLAPGTMTAHPPAGSTDGGSARGALPPGHPTLPGSPGTPKR